MPGYPVEKPSPFQQSDLSSRDLEVVGDAETRDASPDDNNIKRPELIKVGSDGSLRPLQPIGLRRK